MLKIGVLLGDDIGLEVVPECVKVIKAAAARTGLAIDWRACRLACGMFAEECRKVAREYPDVAFDEVLIDTISMRLVMAPQQFDVVVTTNQFGDILTDSGAGLAGGLGLMAEAKHLTPDLGGAASTQEMGDAIAAAV